jgi:hypothetical protein
MEVQPITLLRVTQSQLQSQWKEAVNRDHYLGASTPFGASIRYWIMAAGEPLGCMQRGSKIYSKLSVIVVFLSYHGLKSQTWQAIYYLLQSMNCYSSGRNSLE